LKNVQAVANSLNVQVNNLCQFMPQDRVQEFSKMNSAQRLWETERASTDESLYDDHMKLIDLRKAERNLLNDSDRVKAEIEKAESQHANLERQVNSYQEFVKRAEKVE
jgi:predicted enzyme involved in methoxymalonyl-ACP biosynthesis